MPKGFFPQQDTGRIMGAVMAAQDISFQSMSDKMRRYVDIVMKDPAVDTRGRICGRKHGSEPGPVLRDAEAAGAAQPLPDAAFLAELPDRDARTM